MNAVVYIGLVLFGLCALALWIWCVVDLSRPSPFSDASKVAWFIVIFIVPLGGPIAYFSAKKYVERFSVRDPGRVGRLMGKDA